MNRRNLVLGFGLLVSVALSAWTLVSGEEDTVQPVVRHAEAPHGRPASGQGSVPARDQPSGPAVLTLPQRALPDASPQNAFGAYNYQPPPAPRPVVVAPAPHAPPFPYLFTGRLIIDGRTRYLFLQGDTPLELSVGSSVGEFTLVEASPDLLVFLHGPTGDRVPLSIASAAIN